MHSVDGMFFYGSRIQFCSDRPIRQKKLGIDLVSEAVYIDNVQVAFVATPFSEFIEFGVDVFWIEPASVNCTAYQRDLKEWSTVASRAVAEPPGETKRNERVSANELAQILAKCWARLRRCNSWKLGHWCRRGRAEPGAAEDAQRRPAAKS